MKAPSVQIPVSIMTYSYYSNSHDDEYHPLPETNERTKRNKGDRGYRGIRETAVPIGRVPKSSAARRVLAKKIEKRLEGGVKG